MKVAQNGKSWFKEVFDKNYDNILNYLFYLSGDTALSEDLAQDVFLQLWEKRREIIDDTIRPYLFTIARNNYLKNIRSRKYDLKFRSTYLEKLENETPDYIMELKEFDSRLQKAVSDLPGKSRVVFLMNRIDGMTYREIAENLGVGIKAVEKQMSRALAILREKLGAKI